MLIYREPLPEDCPPETAEEIDSPRVVYRLVRNNPPVDDDFRSQKAENPSKKFEDLSECRARGVSVYSSRRVAEWWTMRPHFKRQGMLVCQVALDRGAGQIQKTGGRAHYTWWPLADYDIPAVCLVV